MSALPSLSRLSAVQRHLLALHADLGASTRGVMRLVSPPVAVAVLTADPLLRLAAPAVPAAPDTAADGDADPDGPAEDDAGGLAAARRLVVATEPSATDGRTSAPSAPEPPASGAPPPRRSSLPSRQRSAAPTPTARAPWSQPEPGTAAQDRALPPTAPQRTLSGRPAVAGPPAADRSPGPSVLRLPDPSVLRLSEPSVLRVAGGPAQAAAVLRGNVRPLEASDGAPGALGRPAVASPPGATRSSTEPRTPAPEAGRPPARPGPAPSGASPPSRRTSPAGERPAPSVQGPPGHRLPSPQAAEVRLPSPPAAGSTAGAQIAAGWTAQPLPATAPMWGLPGTEAQIDDLLDALTERLRLDLLRYGILEA